MPTINRHQRLVYMHDGTAYHLMGPGITDLTIDGNAKTSEKQYVHEQNASGGLSGYAPVMKVTAEGFSGDPVGNYLLDLARTWDVGAKSRTNIVIVDTWEGNATAYKAFKQNVVISIDNPGSGPSGEALAVSANFTFDGSPLEGTFNQSNKTFTPKP